MAITLDTIVNKVFKVVKNGYDNNEVEQFLDEILEEMENREAETNQLKEKVEALTKELEAARASAARPAAPVAAPVQNRSTERHATESFELVLSKAKGAYEEIVSAADLRAEEIIAKANEDAASIRGNAEQEIADLTEKLASLRRQASEYYGSMKKIVDAQSASMEQLKKFL